MRAGTNCAAVATRRPRLSTNPDTENTRYFTIFYYHSTSSEALFSIMNGTHQEQFSASRSKDDPSRLQGVFSSRASEHAGADCEIDYGGSPYSCLGFSRHCGARAECIFI